MPLQSAIDGTKVGDYFAYIPYTDKYPYQVTHIDTKRQIRVVGLDCQEEKNEIKCTPKNYDRVTLTYRTHRSGSRAGQHRWCPKGVPLRRCSVWYRVDKPFVAYYDPSF